MSVTITTYDNRSFEISSEAAIKVSEAMAEGWNHIHLSELNVTLALKDIRRMDNVVDSSKALPHTPAKVTIPRNHDTVVVNEQNQVVKTYKLGGFYSEEQMALRRAENRKKYQPAWRREQEEFEAKLAAKAEVV